MYKNKKEMKDIPDELKMTLKATPTVPDIKLEDFDPETANKRKKVRPKPHSKKQKKDHKILQEREFNEGTQDWPEWLKY